MLDSSGNYYEVPAHIRAEDHILTKAAFALRAGLRSAESWFMMHDISHADEICKQYNKILDSDERSLIQQVLDTSDMPPLDTSNEINRFCRGLIKVRLTSTEINFEIPNTNAEQWYGAIKAFLWDNPTFSNRCIEIIYDYKVLHEYQNQEHFEIYCSRKN
jgi:hypothetical protein